MNKISIIVPVYNVEEYIESCLNSLLDQNLAEVQIICINDGSKDNSQQKIEEYQKKNSKIILINQRNQGLSVARNTGIALANGEFILFVDSDDFLEKNILKNLYSVAKTNTLDILDFKLFSFKDGVKKPWREEYLNLSKPISGRKYFEMFVKTYRNQPFVSACAHLYNTDFINKNKLFFKENIIYEDLPFTAEAYLLAERVLFLDEFVYNYRWNPNSITKGKFNPKKIDDILFITKEFNLLCKKYHIKIPMDHLFATLRAHFKVMCSNKQNKHEYKDYLKINVFKENKYYLYNFRNKIFNLLFKFNLFFLFFKFYFRQKKLNS